MKGLSALNKYFVKYKWWYLSGALFTIISNYFAVAAPQLTGFLTELITNHLSGETNQVQIKSKYALFIQFLNDWLSTLPSFTTQMIYGATFLLVLALFRGLFLFLMRKTIIVASRFIEYDLKNAIYAQYQKLDLEFYKTNATGDLMNRISEDVSRVRMYLGPAILYLINFSTLIILSLYFMFNTSVSLSFLSLIPLPILAIVIYFINFKIQSKSERIQAQISVLTSTAQENFLGIRIVKSFNVEQFIKRKFGIQTDNYYKKNMSLAKLEALFFPSMNLLIGLSVLISVYVGGIFVSQGILSISTIIEFIFYINMLTFPFGAIGWVAGMIQRATASQKRINEFLLRKPEFQEYNTHYLSQETKNTNSINNIEFKNITFNYKHSNQVALEDFNLNIKQGEKIAIMGKSGSGKSSLASALLKLYPIANGNIYIGNTKLNDYNTMELRKQISYVPQESFLFSDTIKNNILFGVNEKVDFEQVVEAAKMASIHDEITKLSNGYDTLVGERGVMLSGGQRQRVSIARALIKSSSVLLFDDCLSSVDTNTERAIAEQLNQFSKNNISIFITHRIFSSIAFDKIIILDNGKIIEQGTHEELLNLEKVYYDIFLHQNTPKPF